VNGRKRLVGRADKHPLSPKTWKSKEATACACPRCCTWAFACPPAAAPSSSLRTRFMSGRTPPLSLPVKAAPAAWYSASGHPPSTYECARAVWQRGASMSCVRVARERFSAARHRRACVGCQSRACVGCQSRVSRVVLHQEQPPPTPAPPKQPQRQLRNGRGGCGISWL